MFNECISLLLLPDTSNWNASNSLPINNIFKEHNSLLSKPDILNISLAKDINSNKLFLPEIKNIKRKKLRIFGNIFVTNNNDKCKLIYNNIEYELKEYFEEIDNNYNYKDLVSFTLTGVNNIKDMSHMFDGCDSLVDIDYLKNNIEHIDSNENLIEVNNQTQAEEIENSEDDIFSNESSHLSNLSSIQQNTDTSILTSILNDIKYANNNNDYTFHIYNSFIILPDISNFDTLII